MDIHSGMAAITRQEHADRLARLKQRMAESGLDAFLVSSEDGVYYLTGVCYRPLERPFFMVVRPEEDTVLLVPALEKEHLRVAPSVDRVRAYRESPAPPGEDWHQRLMELLSGVGQLGVEPSLPLELAGRLAELSPRAVPLLDELRQVKSRLELLQLRISARFSDLGVQKLLAASYHGVSEVELYSQGRAVQLQIMRAVGYDVLTSSVLVGSWPAPLSAQPHGAPSIWDKLGDGPHIALSFLRVNGYAAKCERTYFLAKPSVQEKAAFAAMSEARRLAFALIRPGARGSDIDAATRDFLRAEGYGQRLLHRTGHCIGLGNHEGPWVAEGSLDVLRENMVISIEPGIYLPGVGGFRHSDTLLVTADGYEPLTRSPVDLASLTLTGRKPLTRLKGALVRRAVGVR